MYKPEKSSTYRPALGTAFESLNYDEAESDIVRHKISMAGPDGRYKGQLMESIVSWLMVVVIGIVIGSISSWCTLMIVLLNTLKFYLLDLVQQQHQHFEGWLVLSSFVVGIILMVALLIAWAPEAAGSGIPHVKAYLNGNRLEGTLRLRTLIAKMLGGIGCVAVGMPAGREGPMIHVGSIVANVIATEWSRHLRGCFKIRSFSNDYDRRNFVSMGAAAGVSAAFRAPIGGLLFSMEEVSSFWEGRLALLGLVMVGTSSFTVAFWSGGFSGTFVDTESFVLFTKSSARASTFEIWEVGIFIFVAIGGGLLGVLFNEINMWFVRYRKKHLTDKTKVVDAVLVTWLVVSIFFWVGMGFPCRSFRDVDYDEVSHFDELKTVDLACEAGPNVTADAKAANIPESLAYFNEIATLLVQPQETAVKQLLSRGTAGLFSESALGLVALLYFSAAGIISGTALPVGIFVPTMLTGAAYGRLIGELVHNYVWSGADPGLYALIGASALLAGVTRMSMSLVVILVELSSDLDMLLPLMTSVLVARQLANAFNNSIYSMHISLTKIPMLYDNEVLPPETYGLFLARHIMSTPVVTLNEISSTGQIQQALKTNHHGFPLTTSDATADPRLFAGVISRNKLENLLVAETLSFVPGRGRSRSRSSSKERPGCNFLEVVAEDNQLHDLRPYCDASPFVVSEQLPMRRTFRLFLSMGLRSLCVLSSNSLVVGIITRKDFLKINPLRKERSGETPGVTPRSSPRPSLRPSPLPSPRLRPRTLQVVSSHSFDDPQELQPEGSLPPGQGCELWPESSGERPLGSPNLRNSPSPMSSRPSPEPLSPGGFELRLSSSSVQRALTWAARARAQQSEQSRCGTVTEAPGRNLDENSGHE